MKRIFVILLLAAMPGLSLAQNSEVRSVDSFRGIRAGEGIDVYLKKGTKESVKVEANVDLSSVVTEVSGTYLKIHMRNTNNRWKNVNVKVYVTYVDVDKLAVSSAARIYAEETIKARNLDISASSAGAVDVSVEVSELSVSASSAGDVELKGKAKSATYDSSSAGQIDADDLEAENAMAEASSGGSVRLNVTNALTARASSGGDIRYRGSPSKSITNSTSGGSVRKSS
ncbi:MAG: DUF2807 domain-containing protein [Bacteroidia bacterium]|nr:DUF2807 domain-containing protein [Bacteroidia bacterium]